MAKLVFGLNLSLDGYVDHTEFTPGAALFRHFTEQVRDLTGSVYGRRMYEVMRYWDEDHPEWTPEDRDFAWCQAVRAPGSNVTLAPVTRAGSGAWNKGSIGLAAGKHVANRPRAPACCARVGRCL